MSADSVIVNIRSVTEYPHHFSAFFLPGASCCRESIDIAHTQSDFPPSVSFCRCHFYGPALYLLQSYRAAWKNVHPLAEKTVQPLPPPLASPAFLSLRFITLG